MQFINWLSIVTYKYTDTPEYTYSDRATVEAEENKLSLKA